MNRLMPSTRRIVNRVPPLNQSARQRQAVTNFMEKKNLFQRGISCLSRGVRKVTDFFSRLFSEGTRYSGEPKEGMDVCCSVNPKNHNGMDLMDGTILKFFGISKAILDQDGTIVKRSVRRLRPVMLIA